MKLSDQQFTDRVEEVLIEEMGQPEVFLALEVGLRVHDRFLSGWSNERAIERREWERGGPSDSQVDCTITSDQMVGLGQ